MDSLIYFKALSDETRIRLANILLYHELKVGEIVSVLEMGQSRVSRHLKILSDAGLVNSQKNGIWGLYFASQTGPGRKFLEAIRYLLQNEPEFENDLRRAKAVIEERRTSTLQFFNSVASKWDMLKGEIIGDFDLKGAIFKDAGKYNVAVDMGCGTGDLIPMLIKHADKVIGVDSSPGMLEEARKRYVFEDARVDIRLGEIEHLPLRDKEADFAVISLVLQYMAEPEIAVEEISRALKPGGTFVIADFNRHNQEILREKYGARRLGFEREEVNRWLEKNGFSLIATDAYELKDNLTINVFKAKKRSIGKE